MIWKTDIPFTGSGRRKGYNFITVQHFPDLADDLLILLRVVQNMGLSE